MRRPLAVRITLLGFLLFAAGAWIGIPPRAFAQQATALDSTAIIRAALVHQVQAMRQERRSTGPIKLDPRPMDTKWLTRPAFRAESIIVVSAPINPRDLKPERTPEQLETITRGLDIGTGRLEDVVECPQGPRTCRMNDATAVIIASDPGIVDGIAKLRLQVATLHDDPRQRMGRALYEFTLARTADGWRVVDAVLTGGT